MNHFLMNLIMKSSFLYMLFNFRLLVEVWAYYTLVYLLSLILCYVKINKSLIYLIFYILFCNVQFLNLLAF